MGYQTENDRLLYKFMEDSKAKGVTIAQTAMMWYPGDANGYQYARKRLHLLHERKEVLFYRSDVTNEYIYYRNMKDESKIKKPNNHDVINNNFYFNLLFHSCTVYEYKEKPIYKDGNGNKIIPDAFVIYRWKNSSNIKACFIETNIGHISSMERYERLYDTGFFQEKYGDFPYVVVLSEVDRNHVSERFVIVNMDLKCSNFVEKILML
jgi:hypothetical protein